MGRNFFTRIETGFPIENDALRKRVFAETIECYLSDNCQAWELQADGTYVRRTNKRNRSSAQESLLEALAQ